MSNTQNWWTVVSSTSDNSCCNHTGLQGAASRADFVYSSGQTGGKDGAEPISRRTGASNKHNNHGQFDILSLPPEPRKSKPRADSKRGRGFHPSSTKKKEKPPSTQVCFIWYYIIIFLAARTQPCFFLFFTSVPTSKDQRQNLNLQPKESKSLEINTLRKMGRKDRGKVTSPQSRLVRDFPKKKKIRKKYTVYVADNICVSTPSGEVYLTLQIT